MKQLHVTELLNYKFHLVLFLAIIEFILEKSVKSP